MLAGAIESLAAQTLPAEKYEVLVVDNNSSDDTQTVVERASRRFLSLSLRYLTERRQGLGHARNTGWLASSGRYVAFLDDDARADACWLEKALGGFAGTGLPPLAIGGPIRPFYDPGRPDWFRDEYEERSWGGMRRFLDRGESFSGSNLILSRDGLDRFGGFSTEAGMMGDRLSVGEESAFFERIWARGEGEGRLLYLPDLVVRHHVPGWKMTVGYQVRRAYAEGQNDFRLRAGSSAAGRLGYRVRALCRVLAGCGQALFRLRAFPARERWLVEAMRPVWSAMGSLGFGGPPAVK